MSRARNIRRRNQRRSTCTNCRGTNRLRLWQGRALCRGCYMVVTSAGPAVLKFLGAAGSPWNVSDHLDRLDKS